MGPVGGQSPLVLGSPCFPLGLPAAGHPRAGQPSMLRFSWARPGRGVIGLPGPRRNRLPASLRVGVDNRWMAGPLPGCPPGIRLPARKPCSGRVKSLRLVSNNGV